MIGLSDDFDVYDDYDEDSEVEDIKGITDTVTDYTFTGLKYPSILFKEGTTLEKHKVQVISNMVKSVSPGIEKDISLYFIKDGYQLYRMGAINGMQVSSLIDIVGRDNLIGFSDEGKELKNSLIYTLCTF